MEAKTILTSGATIPEEQPREESRIHFENEHLLEQINVPREPNPRYPNMAEPADEIVMRDLPGYVNARIGESMLDGRLHKTLDHFSKTVGAEELIGDGGMEKLMDLSKRAYENRFDPEMSRRIGAEAQEWVSQWRIAKKN